MSVILDVDGVIEFPGPWTQTITKTIHINNPSNYKTIAFKVKTTAPKLYSVRPNSGFLKPKETLEITIMLQASRKDFSPNQQNRDKFLIVSTLVDDIWMDQSISYLWTIVENHHQDRIHQQKIRCAYALPTQTITTEMNGTSNSNNSNNTNTNNSDNNSNSQEKLEKEPNAREKFNDESTKVSPLRYNPGFAQHQQQQHQQEKKKEHQSQLESINNELNRYKQEIEMLKRQKAISSASNENTLVIAVLMVLVALTVYYYKYN